MCGGVCLPVPVVVAAVVPAEVVPAMKLFVHAQ